MTHQDLERTSRLWDSAPWNTAEVTFWLQLDSVQRRLATKESGNTPSDFAYIVAASKET